MFKAFLPSKGGAMGNRSKRKGSEFEGQVARYLARALDDDGIERRTLQGVNDRGDIAGVKINGKRAVIECKAEKALRVSEYLREAETERENDGAEFGVVVSKRRGIGEARTGEQLVLMTLETFARIVKGFKDD